MAIQAVGLEHKIDQGRGIWNANDVELDGRVEMLEAQIINIPAAYDPAGFFAIRTGQSLQRLGAGVASKITFPTVRYDSHGRYDTSQSRYTAPADLHETSDGRSMWMVKASFTLNDMAPLSTYIVYVFKDGVPAPGAYTAFRAASGNSGMTMEVLAPFYKENNQTPAIEIYCNPQTAVDLDGNNGLFTVWRVR